MPSSTAVSIEGFLRRELRSLTLELNAYPHEALIWALPAGCPNSAGTLCLHLAGNLRHYVGALLGGTGYVRDRDAEFSTRDVPRAELLRLLALADADIAATLPRLTDADLALRYPETVRDHSLETGEFLMQLAVHLAYHLGQVSYHRRLVTGDRTGVGALSAAELPSAAPAGQDPRP